MRMGKLKFNNTSCFPIVKSIFMVFIFFQLIFLASPALALSIAADKTFTDPNSTVLTRTDRSTVEQNNWHTFGLWADAEELTAVAVGDVDGSHPGDEVVVGGDSNKVTVMSGFGKTWAAETIFEDSWYITSLAIGDVYPHHIGNEIIVVGRSENVTMIYKAEELDKWISVVLFEDYDWLYDIAIGDIDPTHPGNEIVTVGDPRHVMMFSYSTKTDTWKNKIIWNNTPDINAVAIGDFDAGHAGNEVVVSGVNVKEVKLREIFYNHSTNNWNMKIMGEIEKEPLEIVIGDFYSGHQGDEIAIVSIVRNVLMVHQGDTNDDWVYEKLWQDTESIRDIEIADVISTHPGNELFAVGYSNSATVLMENPTEPTTWESNKIYTGSTNLNGIAIGEFDTFHSGLELACLQSTGKLFKLQHEVPGFNLFTPQPQLSVPAGYEITVPIIVNDEGGFNEPVTLYISNYNALSDLGIETSFQNDLNGSIPSYLSNLRIVCSDATLPGKYEIEVWGTVTSPVTWKQESLNFKLSILSSTAPEFNMTISPSQGSVVADFGTSFELGLNKINTWDTEVLLEITYLPTGISYTFDTNSPASTFSPPSTIQLNITTSPTTPPGRYFITIKGTSADNYTLHHSIMIALDVKAPEPDFKLELDLDLMEVRVPINGSTELLLNGISLFGFDDRVELAADGLPEGVSIEFTPGSFIPTGNVSFVIGVDPGVGLKSYNISIIGTGVNTGLMGSTSFTLVVTAEDPGFKLSLQPSKNIKINVTETVMLKLTIIPVGGYKGEINITISGLQDTMSWDYNIPPMIDLTTQQQASVFIRLSGLDKPGKFELSVIVNGDNLTQEEKFQLDVQPKKIISNDDGNGDAGIFVNDLVQISAIIIFLLVLLVIILRITKKRTK